jgi:long-chain acyl-CoA synthetase
MNIGLWLDQCGRSHPEAPAVGYGDDLVLTYGELAQRAARRAGALHVRYGIVPGARVAIVAKNCPSYVETMYAAWLAGAAVVPVNAKLHPSEFSYILEHAGAGLAFVSADLADLVPVHDGLKLVVMDSPEFDRMLSAHPIAAVPRDGGDLAWLFYTSGTTGRPKGAYLSHRNLAAMSYAYLAEVDPVAPGDVLFHAAPMSHGSGLYLMAHVMRCGVNVIPTSNGFEPEQVLRAAERWKRLSLFAAPTMVRRMVDAARDVDVSGFRTIVYGGGPMYIADIIDAFRVFGTRLAQIYGQGETPMTITTLSRNEIAASDHPQWRERLGSVGRPFGFMEVAVHDQDDRPLAPGQEGEIVCRGPTVMTGYWNDPAATGGTLRGGWLHTGDVGVFDQHGYLTLKDRTKDLIISGGSNIYPREIEEVLQSHPDVHEVSVVGQADSEWGEVVVAFVVRSPASALGETALDAHCLERIARFKRPKRYVFIDSLPKNNYGKVLKRRLREMLERGMSDSPTWKASSS